MLNVPITLRTVRERVPKGIRLSVPESKTYHVGRARGPPFPNQDTNPGLLQCQLFDLVRELSQVFRQFCQVRRRHLLSEGGNLVPRVSLAPDYLSSRLEAVPRTRELTQIENRMG